MKYFTSLLLVSFLIAISCQKQENNQEKADTQGFDRTVLPIQEPTPQTYTELDVRNATPPPSFKVTPPENAPNVVIVLIDDLGFAGTSTFGGPVKTRPGEPRGE